MKNRKQLTKDTLRQFTGTTQYYRYSKLFPFLLLTDGTKFLAERGECYWLFDKIATLQIVPAIKEHPKLRQIQFWKLVVHENRSATLTCEWDKNQTVYQEGLYSTDFPLSEVRVWIQPTEFTGTRSLVAFLPSEY